MMKNPSIRGLLMLTQGRIEGLFDQKNQISKNMILLFRNQIIGVIIPAVAGCPLLSEELSGGSV